MPITEQKYNCQDTDRQEIHKALDKEFEAVSRTSSAQTIKITNGIFQASLGDKHIYRFQLPKEPEKQIEPDRPYGLRIDKQSVRGGIYALTEHFVEIELNENRGRHIPVIEIIVDLTILIDLVDRTIVRIDREPSKFEITTVMNLIYPTLKEGSEQCKINHQVRADNISLNQEQEKSIANSLARNLNIIWGPPGTGKTRTLQGVIAEFLFKGKKILFASNTNNAIDGLLEPFVDSPTYPIISELKKNDKIVRVGSQSNEKVKNTFSPYAISERKSQEIKIEIDKLTGSVNQKKDEITKRQKKLERYEKFLLLKNELEKLKTALNNLAAPDELQKRSQLLESLSKLLLLLIQYWNETLQYKVIHFEKNSSQLLKVIQQKQGLNIRISQTESILKKSREKKAEIEKSIYTLKNSFIKRIFNNNLKFLEKQLAEVDSSLTSLERNSQTEQTQLNEATLRESELIATISNDVKTVSASICKINLNNCYEALKAFNLASSLNQNSVKELPKLTKEFDFITNNLIQQINFVWQLSTIKGQEVTNKLETEKQNILQQINSIGQRKSEYNTKIQTKSRELRELNDVASIPATHWEGIKSEIANLQKEIAEVDKKIEELKNKIRTLSTQIIKEAQLLCSTLVKASYDETILDCRFDVLIIDEVSMVSIPQLYCAASITKEQIILCGDHLQLQPICQSKSDLAVKWLASSYFGLIEGKENLEQRKFKLETLEPFISVLSEQRRMPEAISSLIKPWYKNAGNNLIDNYSNVNESEKLFKSLGNHFLSSQDDIYIFETKELKTYHNRTEDRSPYNFINAVIVSELLRELIEENNFPPDKILCVSPYRAQFQLTWAIFNKLFHKNVDVKRSLISSVHRTQGNEAEIVIYDLTEGSQGRVTGFIKTADFFIHNVAISRSKAKIIFVCDSEKLDEIKQTCPDAAFNQVFQKIKTSAKRIDAKPYRDRVFKVFSPNDLLNENNFLFTDEMKEKLTVIPSSLYFQILHQDLLEAKENLIIVSPFITLTRWNKLRPMITTLLESNPELKVEILTRPPEKMFGDNGSPNMAAVKVLNDFLKLGFKVKTSEKIHSKLIVIDRGTENAISYMGSLNPLSFNDTDEINIRLADTEIAEQLIKMSMVGKIKSYQEQTFRKSSYQKDIKEAVKSELNQFKWTLAGFHHFPIMLFRNETFNYLIENPPFTDSEFRAVPSITSPSNILLKYLNQFREILKPLYDFRTNETGPIQKDLFSD